LSKEDLIAAVQTLLPDETSEGLNIRFLEADSNQDGVVDFQEFVAWLHTPPKAWGWPCEPSEAEVLEKHVKHHTKDMDTEHLRSREKGIDPNSFKAGRWYSFLNYKEDCHVYVHNYTHNITGVRPANFTELTEEEKKAVKALGFYVADVPQEVANVYTKQKAIPFVIGSPDAVEALESFACYDSHSELLDTTKFKRINPSLLENARKAIVEAMKAGKTLWVRIGQDIPEFESKVCITKNNGFFPLAIFKYKGLEPNFVKEKLYREEDREEGQCPVHVGFRICFFTEYENQMFQMSGVQKSDLQSKMPSFEHMQVIRCYNEADKKHVLATMRGD